MRNYPNHNSNQHANGDGNHCDHDRDLDRKCDWADYRNNNCYSHCNNCHNHRHDDAVCNPRNNGDVNANEHRNHSHVNRHQHSYRARGCHCNSCSV